MGLYYAKYEILMAASTSRAAPPVSAVTKAAAAFNALRKAIEEGRLRPGDRLRTADLSRELGMSSTPIREALRLLQAEGLVEYEEHRGLSVRRFSSEEVDEAYRLRVALEPLATRMAVERASDAQLAELRRIHASLRRLAQQRAGGHQAARLNTEWHRLLYAASGSALLVDFINRLWGLLPVEVLWTTDHMTSSVDNHESIMERVLARDADGAAKLMAHHIRGSRERNVGRIAPNGQGPGR